MRYLFLLFFYLLFVIGFFKTNLNFLPNIQHYDKELHFLVFFIYPLGTYYTLKTFFLKKILLFILFIFLSFGVEFIQLYFTDRVFCVQDIKYSLLGCLLSFGIIGYFK